MTYNNIDEFDDFLMFFPDIELPVNISSEYLEIYSKYN